MLLFLIIGARGNVVHFEKINSEDGLPEASITCILQDSYGFMWFGSTNGLVRYDGYSFKLFKNTVKNSNRQLGNEITTLIELSDSTILFGTNYNGVCEFNRHTEQITVYQHDPRNRRSIQNNYILAIFEDSKKRVWIGTRGGLELFDTKNKIFTHFFPFKDSASQNYISGICEDSKGVLWLFCSVSLYFASFNPQTEQFKTFKYTNQLVKNINWGGGKVVCDRNDNIWLATEFEGIYSYNQQAAVLLHESELIKYTSAKDVSSILFHNNKSDDCYIASDGGGLFLANTKTKKSTHFSSTSAPSALSSDAVLSIFLDKQKSLWLGMYAAGINIYKPTKHKFDVLSINSPQGKNLPQKSVLSSAKTKDGNIVLGTDGGGFVIYNPKIDQIIRRFTPDQSNPKVVKSILSASDGTTWIGTWGDGLYQYSSDWRVLKHFSIHDSDSTKRLSSTSVWSLAEDASGLIWVGSLTYGLTVYSPAEKRFILRDTSNTKLIAGNSIFKIFCDSKKRVWVSNDTKGLFVYENGVSEWPKHFFPKHDFDIIPNEVRDIYEDSEGNLWFATLNNGLFRLLDYKKGVFYRYSDKTILPTNSITQIQEDSKGNLWLGSNKGLIRFNPKTNAIHTFTKEDGVQDDVFNVNASVTDEDGNMYFGGINGVNIFNPNYVRLNTQAPKVILTNLKIYDQIIEPGIQYGNRVFLKKPLYLTDTLVFSASDNVFQLEFAALDFIAPQKNKYKYKLEGFDNQWTSVSAQHRLATYTKLEPASYTFRVKACNSDGVWNEAGTSITIIVLPAWWQTLWFRVGTILLLVSLIVVFYYIRVRRIRNLAFELEAIVRERTNELQETNLVLLQQNTKITEQNRQLENYTEEVTKQNEYILSQQSEIMRQKEILEKQTNDLQEANRTKDKLFSIVAHDIKNPLGVLAGFSELLVSNYSRYDDNKRLMFVNQINISAKSLSGLILNLLEWSRSQTKSLKTQIQQLRVVDLVQDTFDLVHEQASNKSIALTCLVDPHHQVFADRNMIQTILRNLVTNALKFTPNEGNVTIRSLIQQSGYVCISIQDSGIGMTSEQLEKLFVSSTNKSTKGTNNESGTGLGLLICKEFMELQCGRIEVESIQGQGTTFYLYLPDHANITSTQEPSVEPSDFEVISVIDKRDETKDFSEIECFRGKSVLVVDDNDLLRNSVCNTLETWFTIYQAVNGKEAIDILQQAEIHIIISDLNMPICDGLELCRWVKQNERLRSIPFMMHTAESDVRSQIEAYRRGVNAYILKPVSNAVLVARVYALLLNQQ